ncbi:hypothetical protein DYB37_009399 [Aphanomyces astaci]|uniref:Protein kinase domain-containing protein n=1 Tax=Aphanomyces astaci TaxID=112090 RepID=A0A418EJ58_APHAT|nr:hypothetical protein DYB37_009399 [Aphanomyces astaci]
MCICIFKTPVPKAIIIMVTAGMKQRSLHDFFAKSVRTPDSISKRLELVDETDSDIEDDVANLPPDQDDEMHVTYDDAEDDSQRDFSMPKRISFSPSQCSEPDGEPACDDDSQQQHPWSEDFAPPSFSQLYSQQSFCDFSTPQDQPVVHMSHPRTPSPIKKRPRTIPSFQSMPFLDAGAATPTAATSRGLVDHRDDMTTSDAGSFAVESPRGPSPPVAPASMYYIRLLEPLMTTNLYIRTTPFTEINLNPFAPAATDRKRKKKHRRVSPPCTISSSHLILLCSSCLVWLGASTSSKYLDDFIERELLGSGSFSKVFKVIKRFDGWTQRALREVHALVALSGSHHIVRYYDAWIEDDLLYIQLEFMHSCSLATFLSDSSSCDGVSEGTVRKVLKHLATV